MGGGVKRGFGIHMAWETERQRRSRVGFNCARGEE